jgi:IclR family mhp operon transcriptional activator
MIGEHLPLLDTAAGRAYLAFCPQRECEALLDLLRARTDRQGERARNARLVNAMLKETRERGYAVNRGDWIDQGRFGAIAVPVTRGRRVLACLNVIFSRRVIQPEQAAERYLGALRATAKRIARTVPQPQDS